jgi:hypothetical protein
MPAFFDDLNGLKSRGRNQKKNEFARWDEWCEASREHQRKRIERPSCGVIVIGVHELRSAPLVPRTVDAIEVCVDRPGMIVIRARLRSRMDVLERR